MKKRVSLAIVLCLVAGLVVPGLQGVSVLATKSTAVTKSEGEASPEAVVEAEFTDKSESLTAAEADTEAIEAAETETESESESETEEETETESETETETEEDSIVGDLVFAQCENYINIRAESNTDSEVTAKIYNNCAATVLAVDGEWYEISSGNAQGYVKAEYFAIGEEAAAIAEEVDYNVARVEAEYLNIRAEESTDSEVIDVAAQGDEIEVVLYGEEWMKVALGDDVYGYICSEYVEYITYYPVAETLEEEQARLIEEGLLDAATLETDSDEETESTAQAETQAEATASVKTAQTEAVLAETTTTSVTQTESTQTEAAQTETTVQTEATEATEATQIETEAATAVETGQTEVPQTEAPVETEVTYETEATQTETEAAAVETVQTEVPQTEAPAETEVTYETEATQTETEAAAVETVQTEVPQTEAPVETEAPQTEAPVETEAPQTEAPVETEVTYETEATQTEISQTETETTDSSSSSLGELIAEYALQFVGNPYVYGGTSLTNGADCSGFVQSVFANFGIYLSRTAAAQSTNGTVVSSSEAQPGDLFFYSSSGGTIDHVAIYIGNGRIVHAANSNRGICTDSAYYTTPVCIVRCY